MNYHIPEDKCSVKYRDLDYAVQSTIKWAGNCKDIFYCKMDLKSAFRLVCMSPDSWKWLVLKAVDPETQKTWFFVDKNMPFGSSISCSIFQEFSESLRHIVEYRTRKPMAVTNYLDDFLFVSTTVRHCNQLMLAFINLCAEIGVSIAQDKTQWASSKIIFLGIELNGENRCLYVPMDKKWRALNLLQ